MIALRWPKAPSMLGAVALLLTVGGCVSPPPSSDAFELGPRLANDEMPWPAGSLDTLEDVTSTLCTPAVACVEAWQTDDVVLTRFATLEDANDYAAGIDDVVTYDQVDEPPLEANGELFQFVVADYSSAQDRTTGVRVASFTFGQMPGGST